MTHRSATTGDQGWQTVAFDAGHGIAVALRRAPPLRLHDAPLYRADCNSPVLIEAAATLAFVAHFLPVGHSSRRVGTSLFELGGAPMPVRILDDPDPGLGKWIESVWRAADGRLFGWYHAEARAPCAERLMMPHIGALASDDDGASWRILGDLLRADPDDVDCSFRNGSMAGGYGDFTCVPDAAASHFYLHFTSYRPDPAAQGVCAARYAVADRDRPVGTVELWTDGGWLPAGDVLPRPVIAPVRGWRYADADAPWGPAVHWNDALGLYVMLVNRTRGGHGDLVQAGIEVAFNDDLARPDRWTPPIPLVDGGIWYPQVVGAAIGEGDRRLGAIGRFFLSGFSAWEIRFERPASVRTAERPYRISEADIAAIFGPRRSDGGFGPAG